MKHRELEKEINKKTTSFFGFLFLSLIMLFYKMKKKSQRSAKKKLNVPTDETSPRQMAHHASQHGLCMCSLHTPATPPSLSFTQTLIKHTMIHTPLHCQLTGELGLLRACYFITLIFHYFQEGNVLETLHSKASATVLHH